jgi:hypothetical protein
MNTGGSAAWIVGVRSMSPTSKIARFIGILLADIGLAMVLLLVAMLMSTFYLGPDSSPFLRSGLTTELWWILVAAIQTPLWSPAKMRRRYAAFFGALLGVMFFFAVTTVGWRLFRNTTITMGVANQLDVLAHWGGIAIAILVSTKTMRQAVDRHVEAARPGLP